MLSRVLVSLPFVLILACDSPGTTGGQGQGDATTVPDTRDTTSNGGDTTQSGAVCSVTEDCPNVVCYCIKNAGDFPSPVNSRRCIDNHCMTPAQSCADVCAGFSMTWTGESEVIPTQTNPPDTTSPDTNQGNNSCDYAYDDECDDETQGGTGFCAPGTDDADCL